jgi:signal transduction histidine kinase
MQLRLSFARRLALIIWPSLFMLWLIAIFVALYSDGRFGGTSRPLPRQIAALVELLEHSPATERDLILTAVTSPQFAARLEAGDTVGYRPPGAVTRIAIQDVLRALSGLAPRRLSVASPPVGGQFIIAMLISPAQYDIRVGLLTGQTLVIQTRTVLSASMVGWPPGFGMGLLGLGVSMFAVFALNREIRPLARLASMVDKIDPAFELPPLPNDNKAAPEIQALVAAFTRLQLRLTGLLRARMALIGGVSHDVRTFATRLRLRVEKINDTDERARAIADIEDMIALLDDALTASRATAGELSEELLDLAAFTAQEVADRQAQGAPVHLIPAPIAAEVLVLADRLALRRILSNLIENALTYGGSATVQVRSSGKNALLTVADKGPGIPPDQRQALLEPFVRLETSRSRATGGAGLGLAVVNSLVRAHAGDLAIDDAAGGGACITVRLPLFQAR